MFFGLVRLAQVAAQDGVDEAGLRVEAGVLGEFDGFVHGGVAGNAVEPEDLIEAEAQEILQGKLLAAPAGLARDEPVERGLPADGAADEFVAEAAIHGRKPRGGERVVEQVFGEFTAGFAPVSYTHL